MEELIKTIASLHREHRGLQRAVGDMTRRIKGEERWFARDRILKEGGKVTSKFPPVTDEDKARVMSVRARYYLAQNYLEQLRLEIYKKLIEATKRLPVTATVTQVKGFGPGSLAAIVGEAGDLSNYSGPAKLYKRFSLHVINGHAAKRIKGVINGFVPHRRAEMHVIGDSLLRSGGPYADLYQSRKLVEIDKAIAAGLTILPAADIPLVGRDNYISEGQIHKRALRYIEKALLKYVWRAWRDAAKITESRDHISRDTHAGAVPGNGVEAMEVLHSTEQMLPRRRGQKNRQPNEFRDQELTETLIFSVPGNGVEAMEDLKSKVPMPPRRRGQKTRPPNEFRDQVPTNTHYANVPGNGVEAIDKVIPIEDLPPRRRGKVTESRVHGACETLNVTVPGNGVEATTVVSPVKPVPPRRRGQKIRPPVDWGQVDKFRDQKSSDAQHPRVPGNGVKANGLLQSTEQMPPRRRGRPPKIRPPVEL